MYLVTQKTYGTLSLEYNEATRAHDFILRPYPIFRPQVLFNRKALHKIKDVQKEIIRPEPIILQNEDRLTVFNTIDKADILWRGTVDLSQQSSENFLRYQAGLPLAVWGNLFNSRQQQPATLIKKSNPDDPSLLPRDVTGYLGVSGGDQGNRAGWALMKYGFDGFLAQNAISNGDELIVYRKVRSGEKAFDQELSFNEFASPTRVFSQRAQRFMKAPNGIDPNLFYRKNPAILRRIVQTTNYVPNYHA